MDNEPKGVLYASVRAVVELNYCSPPLAAQNSRRIFINSITSVFQYWHVLHDVLCANRVSQDDPHSNF